MVYNSNYEAINYPKVDNICVKRNQELFLSPKSVPSLDQTG